MSPGAPSWSATGTRAIDVGHATSVDWPPPFPLGDDSAPGEVSTGEVTPSSPAARHREPDRSRHWDQAYHTASGDLALGTAERGLHRYLTTQGPVCRLRSCRDWGILQPEVRDPAKPGGTL